MFEKNLSFLLSLHDDIATIKDHKKLLAIIFTKLCDFYDFKIGGLALLDKDQESLRIVIGMYNPVQNMINQPESWGNIFYLDSIPFELPINNPEITLIDSKHFFSIQRLKDGLPPFKEIANNMSLKSLLFIPIQTGGKLLGFLIISQTKYSFNERDKDYLIKIGNIFASALSNTLAYEVLKKKEKEKERQIELLSSLVTVKEKDVFNQLLAGEINKLIPIDYIALHGKGDNSKSLTYYFTKNENKEFESSGVAHSTSLAIQSLISKKTVNKKLDYFNVVDDELETLCSSFTHFKELNKKHKISSLVVLRSRHENMGEISIILGRKSSTFKELGRRINFIFAKIKNSLFTIDEINLSLSLLPQIGLLLSNVNAFEEIKVLTKKLQQEKSYLLEEINLTNNFQEIIGNSDAIKITLNKVEQVAPLDATVLIQSETGTGKELIAKAVHNLSKRKHNSFITVNCAALPAQLIESELFGHEKGSYTGAIEKRIGKFEVADGGTIFLDEIGELPMEIQAKLLRVLQEKEFERLGGKSTISSDVRIIAATNRDLEREIEQGRFRSDLFFRLNVFPITLPPLRERPEDIPLLVKYFIEKYSKRIGKKIESIKKNNLNILMKYEWPGNIRELEHLIERAIIISKGSTLHFENMLNVKSDKTEKSLKSLLENEREHIISALIMTNGKITGNNSASQLLGINGKTLGSKMRKLGIKREDVITS